MLVGSEFKIEIFTDFPARGWKAEKLNALQLPHAFFRLYHSEFVFECMYTFHNLKNSFQRCRCSLILPQFILQVW